MTKPTVDTKYYSGQGICLMGQRNETTGKPEGMLAIGNVPELTLTIESTIEEHKESWSGNRTVDETISTETSVSVAITFESFDPDLLALGLLGTSTAHVANVANDETEDIILFDDKWTYLDKVAINDFVITVGAVGAVVDVDYVVNEGGGAVKPISVANGATNHITGAETAGGAAVTVTYGHTAQHDIQALLTSAPTRYFIFDGLNTQDNMKAVRLEIFKLQTQPFSGLGYINDGIAQGSVTALALADSLIVEAGKSKTFREIVQS